MKCTNAHKLIMTSLCVRVPFCATSFLCLLMLDQIKTTHLVFIKKSQIPGRATPHETDEFLREAIIMKQFDHPNVLCLLGVSVYEDIPCVILPFMSNGDLKTYMRKNPEVRKF